jgi:hypothetical protein
LLMNPFESQERVILVRDTMDDEWEPRVLSKFVKGKAGCWAVVKTIEEAKTATTVKFWNFWKELEPEITPKEEEKEESIPVSQLRGKTIEEIYKLING